MAETANGFREEYFFLSNFYEVPTEITYQGETFVLPTGEHVFQGMKIAARLDPSTNLEELRKLAQVQLAVKAKYWGRSQKIDVPKWNAMAYKCMERTVELKFRQNPELIPLLLETGDMELVEYNDWNDTLWGRNQNTRQGANQLGLILMALRKKINEERI